VPKSNKLVPPTVPLELWRELLEAAVVFQKMAPWKWMGDSETFWVSNERGVRMVSVMGGMGEVYGLVSYRGEAGASVLMRLLSGEMSPEDQEMCFAQDALLMDFSFLKDLRKEDRAILDRAGFKPGPGRPKRFPVFGSHKPGYVPWFIDESEGRVLLEDLVAATRFAKLIEAQPGLLDGRDDGEFAFLSGPGTDPLTLDQIEWRKVLPVPPLKDPPVDPVKLGAPAVRALKQQMKTGWEVASFYSHDRILESPRPYYAKVALAVDAETGRVLQPLIGGAKQTLAETAAKVILAAIQAVGFRPGIIGLDSYSLSKALEPLATALDIRMIVLEELPMLDQARRSLEQYSRRG
jgi:hypothetical protein